MQNFLFAVMAFAGLASTQAGDVLSEQASFSNDWVCAKCLIYAKLGFIRIFAKQIVAPKF